MPNKLSKSRSYNECFGFKIDLVCFGIASDGNISTVQRKMDFLKDEDKFCGTEGMAVPTMAVKCCDELSEIWSTCAEDDCSCKHSFPSIGGLGICSNCGNNICDRGYGENHCNCPQDCEILEKKEDHCGNDICESEYNESNQSCVDDCPIPIWGSKSLYDRTDRQNYYEPFRKKCGNDNCCLESFEKAKKLRSEIFVWINGKMPQEADCPSGYSLQRNQCEKSYMWCEKK